MRSGVLIALVLVITTMITQSFQKRKDLSAQEIINKSVAYYGYDKLDGKRISFDFRQKHYSILRDDWQFQYTRAFSDSTGNYFDTLSNDGFVRYRNSEKQDPMQIQKYAGSVNSVVYFFQLPLPLNDGAVMKEKLADVQKDGKTYHQIKVTFQEEGGGEDFTDEFLYFFDAKTYQLAFFAYLYHTNGGGIRFRETINEVSVKGIKFQDYINYKPTKASMDFYTIFEAFKNGELKEVSRIENKDISITKG